MKTILVSTPTTDNLRVILRFNKSKREFVTHIENVKSGGFSYGHYFSYLNDDKAMQRAIEDFLERCTLNSVLPTVTED